jgi:hypothetical protein
MMAGKHGSCPHPMWRALRQGAGLRGLAAVPATLTLTPWARAAVMVMTMGSVASAGGRWQDARALVATVGRLTRTKSDGHARCQTTAR